MSAAETQHLARITPIEPADANRVLNIGVLIVNSILLVVLHAGWALPILLVYFLRIPDSISGGLLLLGLTWMLTQFCLVFAYPEWPLNRWLCRRVRRSLESRGDDLVAAFDPATRVVELVPRERWDKRSFETATDLMVMRVDEQGVWMSGDRCRYELPPQSIVDAQLESITPPGWSTKTHMVVLYVRTQDGPVELPISFRDHWFGTLRSSSRKRQAFELAERIKRIAAGHSFESLLVDAVESAPVWSDNPYAAPAV